MATVRSYGLIDKNGVKQTGTNDFMPSKPSPGFFELRFNRDVRRATVTATPRCLEYCDNAGRGLTVCNPADDPRKLGVFIDDPNQILGFSFMLIDGGGDDENQG